MGITILQLKKVRFNKVTQFIYEFLVRCSFHFPDPEICLLPK